MGDRVDRVVLIGLRRSGKTTVGRLVASNTGWAFVDTDDVIQSATGRSSADWIRQYGIETFREVECAAVASLGQRPAVVATGGGVPLREENRRVLRHGSLVVYLRVDPWVLADRARREGDDTTRPALAGVPAAVEPFVLFADRDATYRDACDVIVDGSRPAADVARAIHDALASR